MSDYVAVAHTTTPFVSAYPWSGSGDGQPDSRAGDFGKPADGRDGDFGKSLPTIYAIEQAGRLTRPIRHGVSRSYRSDGR